MTPQASCFKYLLHLNEVFIIIIIIIVIRGDLIMSSSLTIFGIKGVSF